MPQFVAADWFFRRAQAAHAALREHVVVELQLPDERLNGDRVWRWKCARCTPVWQGMPERHDATCPAAPDFLERKA